MADKIFQPFVRGDASRVRRSRDGAGLGLSIVQRIAHEHHGSVTVDATPGGGATFVLRLPTIARRSTSEQLADEAIANTPS